MRRWYLLVTPVLVFGCARGVNMDNGLNVPARVTVDGATYSLEPGDRRRHREESDIRTVCFATEEAPETCLTVRAGARTFIHLSGDERKETR